MLLPPNTMYKCLPWQEGETWKPPTLQRRRLFSLFSAGGVIFQSSSFLLEQSTAITLCFDAGYVPLIWDGELFTETTPCCFVQQWCHADPHPPVNHLVSYLFSVNSSTFLATLQYFRINTWFDWVLPSPSVCRSYGPKRYGGPNVVKCTFF